MNRAVRRGMGAAFAAAVTALIIWLSRWPYTAEADESAVIRLSWRARGERVQECRELTEAERRQLPLHMQGVEVCEGEVGPYRLQVTLNGAPVIDDTVRASGARQDRPLYVYRELRVPAGRQRLSVGFSRLGESGAHRADGRAVPSVMEFSESIDLAKREVALITYDAMQRALVRRRSQPAERS